MSNALKIEGLSVSYGPIPALRNISIDVPDGGFVCVLGSNGAGKTTLVRTITGVLYLQKGKCTSGSIKFGDQEITKQKSRTIVRSGVAQVTEGRMLFPHLTTEENLRCGAASRDENRARCRALSEASKLEPHVFAVADHAFRSAALAYTGRAGAESHVRRNDNLVISR